MLKNLMEDIVDNALPSILKKYPKACTCQKCTIDIKAIALNNLKPQYTATENGEVYVKAANELNLQFKSDVTKELSQAIEIVSRSPRHY